ncbi:MAG: hypothetical protein AB8D78_14885 [Akkermansiaceae bacterium]
MNKTTVTSILVLSLNVFSYQVAHSQEPSTKTYQLWSGPEIPTNVEEVPFVQGIEHRTILDAREHTYKFLHGAAIINYKGTFYANWANSPKDENLSKETLQGRHTKDPLGDWSPRVVTAAELGLRHDAATCQ